MTAPPHTAAATAPGLSTVRRRAGSWLEPGRLATAIVVLFGVAALTAPWLAPFDPFDLGALDLFESRRPPAWLPDGSIRHPFGTDEQGRDVLSSVLYGLRVSLSIGLLAVCLAGLVGIPLGLLAGYRGGWVDALIMRSADIQSTFPAILVALSLDGIFRISAADAVTDVTAAWILILSISLSTWVQYARVVRASTLVESGKDYVLAARLVHRRPTAILLGHILPNVRGPVVVLATLNLGFAIVLEATLSFLGVGLSPTTPSLGTQIRIGSDYLLAGEWWIVAFPGAALAVLVLCINIAGDRARDRLNPGLL